MLLQFRTRTTAAGKCKYLGIDTKAETYTRTCKPYISKDIPVMGSVDMERTIERLKSEGYKEV